MSKIFNLSLSLSFSVHMHTLCNLHTLTQHTTHNTAQHNTYTHTTHNTQHSATYTHHTQHSKNTYTPHTHTHTHTHTCIGMGGLVRTQHIYTYMYIHSYVYIYLHIRGRHQKPSVSKGLLETQNGDCSPATHGDKEQSSADLAQPPLQSVYLDWFLAPCIRELVFIIM